MLTFDFNAGIVGWLSHWRSRFDDALDFIRIKKSLKVEINLVTLYIIYYTLNYFNLCIGSVSKYKSYISSLPLKSTHPFSVDPNGKAYLIGGDTSLWHQIFIDDIPTLMVYFRMAWIATTGPKGIEIGIWWITCAI